MINGKLNRDEAVKLVGEDVVKAAENESCEPTNRVGYNGSCQGDELIEWMSSAEGVDGDGNDVQLQVYFYTNQEQEKTAEEDGWDFITWEIEGYEVV